MYFLKKRLTKKKEVKEKEKNIKSKPKTFKPPTLQEAEAYKKEKGLHSVDSQYFINHYEGNGWKIGKNPMKSWKATFSNWHSRNVKETKNDNSNPFGGVMT